MAWYEGISDSVGGFFGDALDFGKDVYGNVTANEQAKAQQDAAAVEKVKNENATKTEQARIELQTEQLAYQREQDAEQRKMMLIGGGVLVVLFLLFSVLKSK